MGTIFPEKPHKVPLGTIPTPSTAIVSGVRWRMARGALELTFEYDRGGAIFRSGVRFVGPRSVAWRAESHCEYWHWQQAYDTVVEVVDSPWVTSLVAAQPEHLRGQFEIHHYMLSFDGHGCIEVAAASWELLPEEAVA